MIYIERFSKKSILEMATVIIVSTLFVVTLLLSYPASAHSEHMNEEEIIIETIKEKEEVFDTIDIAEPQITGYDITDISDQHSDKTGVLVYTHGVPNDPLRQRQFNDVITAIENDLEKKLQIPVEKILHMPYTWDFGLMSLNKSGVKYSIFLTTGSSGPNSTEIHNVTRIFAGIDDMDVCPGLAINESNSGRFDSRSLNYIRIVQKYGPVCSYMGAITIPAPKFDDSIIVLAEPSRPDHPILREIFVKQVKSVSQDPKNEIIVLVGHGSGNDFFDENQKKEISNAARYVENKLGFADSTGVTAREDWPNLSKVAIPQAVSRIKSLLNDTGAKKVILVPATGGSAPDMIAKALDNESINYIRAPGTLPLGEKEFRDWALSTVKETLDFIQKEKPRKSTITPYWNRKYMPTQPIIHGYKFNDTNSNGRFDSGELGLANWTIRLTGFDTSTGAPINKVTTTNATGYFVFENITEGTYLLSEVDVPGWIPTTPIAYEVTVTSNTISIKKNFGNSKLIS